MYDGKFNIHAFSRLLAEGQAKNFAWWNGYWKAGDMTPNELEIRIIRAKDLVKTYHKRTVVGKPKREKEKMLGPLSKNAVVDAFNDN